MRRAGSRPALERIMPRMNDEARAAAGSELLRWNAGFSRR
jgi:hypothetical protein